MFHLVNSVTICLCISCEKRNTKIYTAIKTAWKRILLAIMSLVVALV